jgi:hypothetical protein
METSTVHSPLNRMTMFNRSTATLRRTPRPPRAGRSHRASGHWHVGVVVDSQDGSFQVLDGHRSLKALASFSCLVLPEPGDTVSCLDAGASGVWITSILSRASAPANGEAAPLRLSSGPVRWTVRGGDFSVKAPKFSIDADDVHVASQSLELTTDRAHVVVEGLRFIAGTIKLVASTLSSAMTRVQHFSETYTRSTTGLDRVSAAHVELEADTVMHLRSQHTLVDGSSLVKARGGQIHLG